MNLAKELIDLRSEIERVAYEIYLERGAAPGHALDDWLTAEDIVLSRLESDRRREEQIGTGISIHKEHVIEPTSDTVTS